MDGGTSELESNRDQVGRTHFGVCVDMMYLQQVTFGLVNLPSVKKIDRNMHVDVPSTGRALQGDERRSLLRRSIARVEQELVGDVVGADAQVRRCAQVDELAALVHL
jgi:hypothetical protein